jgi:O-antigen/teichoic acid export membrane protein
MSIIKKLAGQTAVYGISTMIGRFINYLLVPLYTAKLTHVADYGVVGVMFSYASFFAIIFSMGLETAFFHFAQKESVKKEKVFSTATLGLIFTGVVFSVLTIVFAQSIMSWVGYPSHPEYAVYFTLILSADAVTAIGFAWLRNAQKPWNFAWVRLTNIFINVLANIFFLVVCPWLVKNGVQSPLLLKINNINQVTWIFISNLIASLLTFPLLLRTWQNLKFGFDYSLYKRMLEYSFPLIFIGLAGMINETFDRILIKKLMPADVADYNASIYNAFYKLSLVLTLFVQAFRFAVEPYFFQQSKSMDAKQQHAYIMKWFVYAVCIIFLGTILILPWIAPLLIRNPEYFNHPYGMKIVPILLVANMMLGIYYTLSVWYKVTGQTKIGAIPAFAGAIITVVLNLIFIPQFGILASAFTTMIAYTSMVIFGYLLSRKYYPIPFEYTKILTALAFSFVLSWGMLKLDDSNLNVLIRIFMFLVFVGGVVFFERNTILRKKKTQ